MNFYNAFWDNGGPSGDNEVTTRLTTVESTTDKTTTTISYYSIKNSPEKLVFQLLEIFWVVPRMTGPQPLPVLYQLRQLHLPQQLQVKRQRMKTLLRMKSQKSMMSQQQQRHLQKSPPPQNPRKPRRLRLQQRVWRKVLRRHASYNRALPKPKRNCVRNFET